MLTIERNRKLDQLTETRTQILQNFLEVLKDQLMQAEALGMEYEAIEYILAKIS